MFRSLTFRVSTLGLIGLLHVALFADVVQQLCMAEHDGPMLAMSMPMGDMHNSAPSRHDADMSHGSPADGSDQDHAPSHDHGSCTFCCPYGQPDVARLESVSFQIALVVRAAVAAGPVELSLSPTRYLYPLPNPPPSA